MEFLQSSIPSGYYNTCGKIALVKTFIQDPPTDLPLVGPTLTVDTSPKPNPSTESNFATVPDLSEEPRESGAVELGAGESGELGAGESGNLGAGESGKSGEWGEPEKQREPREPGNPGEIRPPDPSTPLDLPIEPDPSTIPNPLTEPDPPTKTGAGKPRESDA